MLKRRLKQGGVAGSLFDSPVSGRPASRIFSKMTHYCSGSRAWKSDYVKAEPLMKEALEIYRKTCSSEHPDTMTGLDSLGQLYMEMGEFAKAEPLFKEALTTRQKVLGREHPASASSLNNLASSYHLNGEYAKAEPLFQEAVQIDQKVLGPEHSDTVSCLNNFALLEFDLGRSKEATALAHRASDAQLKLLSKMFSFSSESQRLAYLASLCPYGH
jgi:tetratricopeptide (TPR) repeat protein